MRAFTLATLLLSSVAVAQEAPPPDDALNQARTHFEAGKSAYLARDYAGAIREFKAAQQLRPSPVLDYNIGLAYEGLGKPRAAKKYFQRYLEGKPDAQNRGEVEQKIAAMDQMIAQQQAQPQVDEEQGAAPPPVQPEQQYQYTGDPYGYQSPPPEQPQPKKKKSYWWVIFPILGGVTLIAVLALYVYVSIAASAYGCAGCVTQVPAVGPHPSEEPGTLFRF